MVKTRLLSAELIHGTNSILISSYLLPSSRLKPNSKLIIENIQGKLVLIFRFSFQVFINRCFVSL